MVESDGLDVAASMHGAGSIRSIREAFDAGGRTLRCWAHQIGGRGVEPHNRRPGAFRSPRIVASRVDVVVIIVVHVVITTLQELLMPPGPIANSTRRHADKHEKPHEAHIPCLDHTIGSDDLAVLIEAIARRVIADILSPSLSSRFIATVLQQALAVVGREVVKDALGRLHRLSCAWIDGGLARGALRLRPAGCASSEVHLGP